MQKKVENIKANSKNGIAIGKMGSSNSIIQNNETLGKKSPWIKIIIAIIGMIGVILAAIITATWG